MDEATKTILDLVYAGVERAQKEEQSLGQDTIILYVLCKMLDLLDSIEQHLIAVEKAINKREQGA